MEDTAKKFCSIIFDLLESKGVRHIVCSSGSRNVPLLLAAASRPKLKKHFAIDERTGGFLGLGISLVSQQPVGLVCTSGTALLNYAPAVAEAYYQSIPLIVISADRPVQWIDQDDSQTLRQDGALDNYVKKSYSIPALGEDNPEMLWYVNRIVNDAINQACEGRPGPVHINVHLGEPLNGIIERKESGPRLIKTIEADVISNKEIIKNLANEIADSKIMFVAGFYQPDSTLQKAVSDFCKFPNVTVMAESISNIHLKEEDYMVDSVLTSYSDKVLDSYAPDIVISIGGALVSRKLKEYLRRNSKSIKHWSLGFSHTTSDPFMSLDIKIELDPIRFLKSLNSVLKKFRIKESVKNYQYDWKTLKEKASHIKETFISDSSWSELKAFDYILKKLPSDYNLFLSNGTPIRYAQIINYPLPHASYCNRGVSGIDGTTSTAIGGAIVYKGRTLLITGDLSMAYDIGAFNLKNVPESFKIIVMDNQGGGIFRFIPSTNSLEIREEFLCQPPLLPLKELASGYDWSFYECSDLDTLEKLFPEFISNPHKSILKISCDGERSAEVLKEYMGQRCE